MKNLKIVFIVFAICCLLIGNVQAGQWSAADFGPGFMQSSQIIGVSAKDQVGNIVEDNGVSHAVKWDGAFNKMTVLGNGIAMASNIHLCRGMGK